MTYTHWQSIIYALVEEHKASEKKIVGGIKMLDTIQVSRNELFNLHCNIKFSLSDFRARAETAIKYGDRYSYWTAQRDYEDTIRLLESPVFDDWKDLTERYVAREFPKWKNLVTNCDDVEVVFSDGSTVNETCNVPF